MVIMFSLVLIANYVPYKTWGSNEHYYLPQDGFEVTCDYMPLQKPTNCRFVTSQAVHHICWNFCVTKTN